MHSAARLAILAMLAMATIGGNAHACLFSPATKLSNVKRADLVVIGEIRNYEIVRNTQDDKQVRATGEKTGLPAAQPDQDISLVSDYARFEIDVTEVLHGSASGAVMATWDASTFGEPETFPPGRHLIALRRAGSGPAPLRGPNAAAYPDPEPGAWTVLHPPCASQFIFKEGSGDAAAIRDILSGKTGEKAR